MRFTFKFENDLHDHFRHSAREAVKQQHDVPLRWGELEDLARAMATFAVSSLRQPFRMAEFIADYPDMLALKTSDGSRVRDTIIEHVQTETVARLLPLVGESYIRQFQPAFNLSVNLKAAAQSVYDFHETLDTLKFDGKGDIRTRVSSSEIDEMVDDAYGAIEDYEVHEHEDINDRRLKQREHLLFAVQRLAYSLEKEHFAARTKHWYSAVEAQARIRRVNGGWEINPKPYLDRLLKL